jgi:hypothetical protein
MKNKKNRWRKENNKEEELGKCYQHATKCVYGCLGEAREREKKKRTADCNCQQKSAYIACCIRTLSSTEWQI